MRRRRAAREARERWVFGPTAPLARALNSQAAMAAITPRVPRVISLLELAPGRRYLDIGCGTAAYAHLVAARAGLDEPPVTVDLVAGPGPVELLGWPEKLPFRDDSFDAISSFYFLHRFDDDVTHAFAQEVCRAAARGFEERGQPGVVMRPAVAVGGQAGQIGIEQRRHVVDRPAVRQQRATADAVDAGCARVPVRPALGRADEHAARLPIGQHVTHFDGVAVATKAGGFDVDDARRWHGGWAGCIDCPVGRSRCPASVGHKPVAVLGRSGRRWRLPESTASTARRCHQHGIDRAIETHGQPTSLISPKWPPAAGASW